MSLGLDSAVHAISKALAAADRRLQRWNDALAKMADNKPVENCQPGRRSAQEASA